MEHPLELIVYNNTTLQNLIAVSSLIILFIEINGKIWKNQLEKWSWSSFSWFIEIYYNFELLFWGQFQFPGIGASIYGEESNKFTNVLGESISVQVLQDQEATAQLLCRYKKICKYWFSQWNLPVLHLIPHQSGKFNAPHFMSRNTE